MPTYKYKYIQKATTWVTVTLETLLIGAKREFSNALMMKVLQDFLPTFRINNSASKLIKKLHWV